jgi:hypothetical protein
MQYVDTTTTLLLHYYTLYIRLSPIVLYIHTTGHSKMGCCKAFSVVLPLSSSSVGSDLSQFFNDTLTHEVMELFDLLEETQVTAWKTNEKGGAAGEKAE